MRIFYKFESKYQVCTTNLNCHIIFTFQTIDELLGNLEAAKATLYEIQAQFYAKRDEIERESLSSDED